MSSRVTEQLVVGDGGLTHGRLLGDTHSVGPLGVMRTVGSEIISATERRVAM